LLAEANFFLKKIGRQKRILPMDSSFTKPFEDAMMWSSRAQRGVKSGES
jgi:hypothetical protein